MHAENRIQVMIADDHPIVRNGLQDALRLSDEIEIVGLGVT